MTTILVSLVIDLRAIITWIEMMAEQSITVRFLGLVLHFAASWNNWLTRDASLLGMSEHALIFWLEIGHFKFH